MVLECFSYIHVLRDSVRRAHGLLEFVKVKKAIAVIVMSSKKILYFLWIYFNLQPLQRVDQPFFRDMSISVNLC